MSPRTLALAAAFAAAPLMLVACGESPKPPVEDAPTAEVAAPTEAAPAAAEAAPLSEAAKTYEGKIVHQPPGAGGKEDGWYLVKDGKRRWISDGAWLGKNGYQAADVIEISAEDFKSIVEDPAPLAL